MSRFNFEGDVHGARKPQLDFIGEVLQKKGFKGSTVILEPVGKAGDNYMANVKRVIAKDNDETFKMIVKMAPENPLLREIANVALIFQNELMMYTEVLPKFDQKQKSAGIPENERFRFAKCYGAFNEAPNEVIALEDLKESNFDILNRFEPLTNENVHMVLKNFALYHALSFATRYQEPETYATFQQLLAPNLDVDSWNENAMQFFSQLETQALEIADSRCEKVIKGIIAQAPKVDRKIRSFVKTSKHSVIQQGDAWTNNIMFRFENQVPVQCVLVDYQMVKENSPVFDLMYFLFNSTTHDQRSQYFYEYIDYYHSELDKALHNFGLKANFVYPRDRLDADMKLYGKLILAISLLISSVVTKNTEDAEKMRELMELTDIDEMEKASDVMLKSDGDSLNLFKIRIEGISDSFSQFGLI